MTLTKIFYSKKTERIYKKLPQNGDAIRLRICSCGFICHANDISGPNYNKIFEHGEHESIEDLTSSKWLDLCKTFVTSPIKINETSDNQNFTDSTTQTVEEETKISLQDIFDLITKNQEENSKFFNEFMSKYNQDIQRLTQEMNEMRGKQLF